MDMQRRGWLLVEDGNHGEYRPRPDEFGIGRWAFIRAADMDGGHVLFDSAQRINDVARKRIIKGVGAGGDVLLSHKGTVGKLALVPQDAPPFVCSPQTTFWRVCDQHRISRRFLYYFMCSDEFRQQLDSRKGETDMADYVSLTAQRELWVTLPTLSEQKAIARVLGVLDDKIELNRRMNQTLEGLARALFKSWFVDFDPVVAKAAGKKPVGMSAQTAALFPDRFQDSAIGPIPNGWKVAAIGELVDVVGGSTPSTANAAFWEGGTIAWATPKDLSNIADPVLIETERKITSAGLDQISSGLLPKGTVLLSSRAPVGYLAVAEIPVAVNQGFIAIKCGRATPNLFVLFWVKANMDEIESRANGTTFMEISKANFRPIPAVVPSSDVVRCFQASADRLLKRIVANIRQSRSLATLRDALLPQLMSGEMRIQQAGKLVEQMT